MYGLPQAGILAQELLEKRLLTAEYVQSTITPGYWKHNWRPISFTLVVDNFGVKNRDTQHKHKRKHNVQVDSGRRALLAVCACAGCQVLIKKIVFEKKSLAGCCAEGNICHHALLVVCTCKSVPLAKFWDCLLSAHANSVPVAKS